MASTPFRYQSPDEGSVRWFGFPYRDGDIVISTRSRTGTTWVQMILTEQELVGYHARVARLAMPDVLAWLHDPGQHPKETR